MSFVEELHRERKARLARIAARAFVPPKPAVIEATPEPAPEPKKPVKRRYGFHVQDKAYERAWSITMLNCEPTTYEPPPPPTPLRVEQIQRAVCEHYGIERSDLISARRTGDLIRPRHVMYYLSKKLTPKSLPEIGRRSGGRDHTTVLHGVRKIERLLPGDDELRASVEMLIEFLGGKPQ